MQDFEQEIERVCADSRLLSDENVSLRSQLKVAVEALSWYGAEKTYAGIYLPGIVYTYGNAVKAPIDADKGEKAREALATLEADE